jgi:hypothetical protein
MYFGDVISTIIFDHLLYTCYVQFSRRSRSKMEVSIFISLILIFASNVLFFFSGICLNSVVILSFWRSVQLRKKLCYFMIMVLSCCDLLLVSIHNPLLAVCTMLWLNGKLDIYRSWVLISNRVTSLSVSFSLLALLVMNFDRYLATSYPIFHRTSVTKGRLLTLLAILISIDLTLALMSVNDFLISMQVHILILFVIVIPPMLFINYKLFAVARKCRRNNGISPEMKRTFSLKNISSCLLAVACLAVLSIPVLVYIGLRITSKYDASVLDNGQIAAFCSGTIISMNSTFNCLIFFWKNKILRTEGMKVIKGMKICLKP